MKEPSVQAVAAPRRVSRFVRERVWWLALLVVWGAVVGLSLEVQVARIREQSLQVGIEGARNMFRMVMLTRNWNASHGGIYVPVTPETPPNPYLEHPRRDVTTTDGQQLTMVNPAYMTRLIASMAASDGGVEFRLTSLRPIRPENIADPWERQALERFERGEVETTGVEHGPKGEMLRYMAPLKVQESCLACHARQGYKLGDVRGGISVTQRFAPIEATTRAGIRQTSLAHAAAFAVVFLGGWALLEALRRRWLELDGKIAELEAAHSQLLQSEKMASIGVLAAGVAHEIRNPLGIIRSSAELLQRRTDQADAGTRRILGAIFDESVRLSQTVNDFLDYARPRQPKQNLVDVSLVLDQLLAFLEGDMARRGVAVERETEESLFVHGDKDLLYRAFYNILINGQQAMDGPGILRISGSHDGDGHVRLEFLDSGPGFDAATVGNLLDPFFTTKDGGTGLGLPIVQSIITSHGGEIQLENGPEGGALVRVLLPEAHTGAQE